MKNTLQFSRASVPLHVDRDFLAREQMGAIWEVIPNIGGRPFILQAFGDKALDIHANGSAVLIIELRDLGDARMMTSRIHDTRIISIDPPYFDHASDDELAALLVHELSHALLDPLSPSPELLNYMRLRYLIGPFLQRCDLQQLNMILEIRNKLILSERRAYYALPEEQQAIAYSVLYWLYIGKDWNWVEKWLVKDCGLLGEDFAKSLLTVLRDAIMKNSAVMLDRTQ